MMRLNTLFVIWGVLFFATVAMAEESMKLIGGGAVISSSPYRGIGAKITPLPLIRYDYKDFYIKGVEAGYRFFKTEDVTLSILGSPRFMGYHSSDSDALQGMENRNNSFDAGVSGDYKLPKCGGIAMGASILTDVAGVHDGQVMTLSLSKKFSIKHFKLTPSLGARLQTSSLVDYYYGVRASEVAADRPEYKPGTAVNYFGDMMFNFGIHPKWIVITKVGVEFLDHEITRSPIVNKDYLVTGIIGVTRRF
ncbi:MAG: MipA/OmpV family protein [Candidatus Omnitrophica bacterium]|nr:MipA/OmpV family protein [Candidatus Omnitrophota bacterium]